MSFALTDSTDAISNARNASDIDPRAETPHRYRTRPLLHHFEYPRAEFSVALWPEGFMPESSERLVQVAYSKLGYTSGGNRRDTPRSDSVTLHAEHASQTIGTLTVNFDGPCGLQGDALYPEGIQALRRLGPVCEFTRLALDRDSAGKEVLCGLFYVAYVYAHQIRGASHLAIEVNPRHEAFYARMLGFRRAGPERICPRVSAPAVLLTLSFEHTRDQISDARADTRAGRAALYRYAPPLIDEQSLVRRMRLIRPAP